MSEVRNGMQPTPQQQQQPKPKQKDQLLENAMGLSPIATVFYFPSSVIEDTILKWLESKRINTSSIMVRAILKDDWRDKNSLVKASKNTRLPFLVVLFKQLDEGTDFNITGGLDPEVRNNLRAGLNNFRDSAQLHLNDDTPLNKVLTDFNGHKVYWNLQKKVRRAYTVLNSDSVMAMCFKLAKADISNYQFDYLDKPHSKVNPETRRKEFWSKIAFSRVRGKRRPIQDPLNDIN